ncbi:MAG: SIS domain-containing protein [Patescibacteria group bacterium]
MTDRIVVLDKEKMLEAIQSWPDQLEAAWSSHWTKDPPIIPSGIEQVLICGLGGSGIAGELLKEFGEGISPRIILTWADYRLPHWVNQKTLVVLVSYSGDTEEVIDAAKLALAKKIPTIALTGGGKLAALLEENDRPVLKIDFKGAPRTSLGSQYGLLLVLAAKLDLLPVSEKEFFLALKEFSQVVREKAFFSKAQNLALTLNNKVPVILAHRPLTAVARRWQTQLNENSKTFGLAADLPEAGHNFIVGLDFAVTEKLAIFYLESAYGFSRNLARRKLLGELLLAKGIGVTPIAVETSHLLSEQWLMIYFGDLLSYFLAGVYGIDPSPVEIIEQLKTKLAKL